MPLLWIVGAKFLNTVLEQERHHARVAVPHCQDGCFVAGSKSRRSPRRASALVCRSNCQHRPQPDDEGRHTASRIGGSPCYSCIKRVLQRVDSRLRWWVRQKSTPATGTKHRDHCRQGVGSRRPCDTLCFCTQRRLCCLERDRPCVATLRSQRSHFSYSSYRPQCRFARHSAASCATCLPYIGLASHLDEIQEPR